MFRLELELELKLELELRCIRLEGEFKNIPWRSYCDTSLPGSHFWSHPCTLPGTRSCTPLLSNTPSCSLPIESGSKDSPPSPSLRTLYPNNFCTNSSP